MHYLGPAWQLADGSGVTAKIVGKAPGTTPGDIGWYKLDVVTRRGTGPIASATTVQRINTKGGMIEGPCPTAGAMRAAEYGADYVFLKKGG